MPIWIQKAPLAPQGSSKLKEIVYLEPSHCPFICSMAVVASFFLTKETNPYPFDFPVTISLTTRQSLISPKGANAVLKVSVSISGDKSPTKMWWCWDVSTLPCCVPVELVAQLTCNKIGKNCNIILKILLKVNWAMSSTGTQHSKVDKSQHHHIFVGDLSPEIETETLRTAFAPFWGN